MWLSRKIDVVAVEGDLRFVYPRTDRQVWKFYLSKEEDPNKAYEIYIAKIQVEETPTRIIVDMTTLEWADTINNIFPINEISHYKLKAFLHKLKASLRADMIKMLSIQDEGRVSFIGVDYQNIVSALESPTCTYIHPSTAAVSIIADEDDIFYCTKIMDSDGPTLLRSPKNNNVQLFDDFCISESFTEMINQAVISSVIRNGLETEEGEFIIPDEILVAPKYNDDSIAYLMANGYRDNGIIVANGMMCVSLVKGDADEKE